jgi:hypothetical protein
MERFSHGKDGFWQDPDGLYVEYKDHLAKLRAVEEERDKSRAEVVILQRAWKIDAELLEARARQHRELVERVRKELERRVSVLEKGRVGLSPVNRIPFEDEARAYRAAAQLLAPDQPSLSSPEKKNSTTTNSDQAGEEADHGCPDDPICQTCPASHEDDVCLPHERKAAEDARTAPDQATPDSGNDEADRGEERGKR